MKPNLKTSALMIALAGTVALAACKKQEEAATPPPAVAEPAPAPAPMEPAPAAVSVTSVNVGNATGADMSVTPMTTFGVKDKIIVSVNTQGDASNQTVEAKLTFQDGQVAGQQSQPLNTTGAGTTNIEFTNANPWPAGKYKVDVMVNGQPAGMTQEIEVK
ncbi:hypothetical protein [Pseudoxanthomonas wuyuanensis]